MKRIAPLLLSAVVLALAGCAYPSVGDKPADVPPQIVKRNDVLTWDNPGAFGPVPAELAERAQAICATLDKDRTKHEARGYHPRAMDLEGKPFPGGGYYCVPKT